MMATAWRSTFFRFPDPWPLHHPQYSCYYLRLLLWLTILAFFVILMEVPGVAEARVSSKGCLQRERDALLHYKAAIEDPSGRLSSWRAQEDEDCCAWAGVVCYNKTGGSVRVAELNLGNPNVDQTANWKEYTLRGELLHPSILSLIHLRSLNLSFNDFNGTQIPPLIDSLRKLRYLDLFQSNIGGMIPPHLGNLTNLRHLHLSSYPNSVTVVDSLDWLSGLSSNLIYLGMSYLDLSAVSHNWISAVNMLPSLQKLYLYDSKINNIPLSLSFHLNLTSLVALDLGGNNFDYSSFPNWLWNLTTLSSLALDESGISETLPAEIGNLIGLTYIDLSSNLLSGPFPDVIMNLSSLSELWLNNCSLSGPIPSELGNLTTLNCISLSDNSLSGTIPSELGNLTTLNTIYLSDNSLSGTIPNEIWKLVHLNDLDFSYNSLEGEITDFHRSNLAYLDLSYNKIRGTLPPTSLQNLNKLKVLFLNSNRFEGLIPRCWHNNSLLEYIDLGNNMLFGEIPSSLGNLMRLQFLHLNDNNLNGHLPSSLQNCTQLVVVDLGGNKFSGNIPLWIGQSWQQLHVLLLRSNMFDGNINPQLGYLRNLQIIDFANNKLSGPIPHSFGNFSTMISTSTPSPYPFEEIIDFIDSSIIYQENITVTTKGNQLTFSSILHLMKSIDLSNNSLTGEIPKELGYLAGLNTLNLSRNYFRGKIPYSIGGMSSLETLDLSFNNLSGPIPQSLSQLNALNHLNMSYNNLSGSIPTGHQLQTLDDASIYIGNPCLCGDIVNKSCFRENNINVTSEEHAKSSPMSSIYFSCTFGYLVGLWSVFILVLFKKKWRYSYFKKIDEIYDKVYVIIKIRLNRIVSG